MRRLLTAFVPLLAAGTHVPAVAQPRPGESGPIVITGTPLRDTERALRECVARQCPPEEDIKATLAHAENLFVAGDYAEARRTTRASIRRNSRHAAAHPVPVSSLYRAHSRIAAHLGEGEEYLSAANNVRRALKAGLPDDDPRLIGADLERARAYASMGSAGEAHLLYSRVQRAARAIGRPDLAATAQVRQAWLRDQTGDRAAARRELSKVLEAPPGPGMAVPRLAARVLLGRLDRKAGKAVPADALIAEAKALGGGKPVLLFAPAVELPAAGRAGGDIGPGTNQIQADDVDDVWADIGFWVGGDGRVEDVEILRGHGGTAWAEPLLRSIAGRIYAPAAGEEPSYRVERYTYTALWGSTTGTRLRVRGPDARIEYLDLTAD